MLLFGMIEGEEQKKQFQEIYEENYRLMYHVALGILKNPQSAEDAVHSAFVKLAEKFEKYQSLECREMTSLCVIIVKNKSLDMLRVTHAGQRTDIDELVYLLASDDKSPLEQMVDEENRSEMETALLQLPESLRLVLELKFYHDYANGEIADILDINKKNVEMRLYRAKQKLKEVLQNDKEA